MISALLLLASLPAAQQQSIKNHFDTQLFDGQSARWKWPPQSEKKDFYCGWVNAKNRFGAYTGWKPYFVMLEGGKVSSGFVIDDNRVISQVFGDACQKNGYDILTPPD